MTDLTQPYLLCLQDPADPLNDLGRKGFGIKHIKETIRALELTTRKRVESNEAGSILAPLVGGSYALYQARRVKLEEYGHEISRR